MSERKALFSVGVVVALVLSGLVVTSQTAAASKGFTFKITVWASDAQPDMDNMKVKVQVKHKEPPFATKSKSKDVDFGKILENADSSTIKLGKFEFKKMHNGDTYTACIGGPGIGTPGQCHDGTITKKKVTEKIAMGFWD